MCFQKLSVVVPNETQRNKMTVVETPTPLVCQTWCMISVLGHSLFRLQHKTSSGSHPVPD
jgi:hypothetical protein